MMPSKIPYCDKVLEVTGGCTKCSLGCKNDWALDEVWRMSHNPLLGDKWQGLVEKKNGVLDWTGKIKLFAEALQIPLKRKKPTTYFVDSKADLFHEKVPIGFLTHVFDTIYQCPQHTFLILTKRPEQALKMMWGKHGEGWRYFGEGDFHPNVHLGVTVCNQPEADEKIPIGLQIPGFDWISFEPLLGDIDLRKYMLPRGYHIIGEPSNPDRVVVGCESGPKRRECKPEWIVSIVGQCKAAGVDYLIKQVEINGKVEHNPRKCAEYLGV